MTNNRDELYALIRRNIAQHGHHVYLVTGGPVPRYAYTIGLKGKANLEVVLAGACQYTAKEVTLIVNRVAEQLMRRPEARTGSEVDVEELGIFGLRAVHPSWSNLMLLGAIDFFQTTEIMTLQIVPDESHCTIDVPDMGRPWTPAREPVWRWLNADWLYGVPKSSIATTDLAALRGGRVTEAARWEEGEWELFSGTGPDVSPEDVRVVPLGVLLGADETLSAVTNLEIGAGLWRNPGESEWHPWIRSG